MNTIQTRYPTRFPFSVQERDIDLLIMDQIHTSDEFVNWLSGELGLPGATVVAAHHSVQTEYGETDVLLDLRHNDQSIAVMIEDKIGAPMQPEQCERYHVRGSILRESGKTDCYLTVLCAPLSYLNAVPTTQSWGHRLALEEVAQRLEIIGQPGWEWRQAIILNACSRIARAREADNRRNLAYDDVLIKLKKDYRAFVNTNYPMLNASRQEGRDREYYLNAVGLPSGIRFKHAFFRGEISLILEKKWVERAQQWLSGQQSENFWVCMHGSELHLRDSVDVLDPLLPLDQQPEPVRGALDRISRMIPWAKEIALQS